MSDKSKLDATGLTPESICHVEKSEALVIASDELLLITRELIERSRILLAQSRDLLEPSNVSRFGTRAAT